MSSTAMKWAKQQRIRDGVLLSVVKRLAEIADDAGASWASQATLASTCGLSERSVRRALRLLASLGVITRTPRSRGHLGRTTDRIVLALHRTFDIPRATVRRERAKAVPQKLQPDTASIPTGQRVRGIMKGTTYPLIQEGKAVTHVEGYRGVGPTADVHPSAVVLAFPRRGAA